MVFIILLGAAMLTSGFRAFGGEELVRDFLQDLPGGFWTQFIVVMAVIFLLGFFLDFIEIAVVVVPIIAPILLAETGANVTAIWLGVMIGVNLQTSFLTPPFGFALFYLKGVAPKNVVTLDIWKGVIPFIILQLIGLGIVGFYPSLVNYLPNRTYLTSHVAPPPMNPTLQYCLQEYKFSNFEIKENEIKSSIDKFDDIILANLPADKLSFFQRHVDNSRYSFEIVDELKKAEKEYNLYIQDYRDLHFSVRKKQKKIRKISKRIEKLEAEIRNLEKDEISKKNKLELEIEEYELEIAEINKSIPDNWKRKNKEFEILYKAKNIGTKKYRKTVDNAYEDLMQIKQFINDGEALEKLRPKMNELSSKLKDNNYTTSISVIDEIFEKFSEISGTDELADKLDYMISIIDSEEIDNDKLEEVSKNIFVLYDQEINWRKKFKINVMNKINKHDDIIKNTIGLRLQERLTKEQAKLVASCKSVHRDISLNF